jgi:hypothetical protein
MGSRACRQDLTGAGFNEPASRLGLYRPRASSPGIEETASMTSLPKGSDGEATSDKMLAIYTSFLQTRFSILAGAAASTASQKAIDDLKSKIEALASGSEPATWDKAYEAERMLVLLQGGENLNQQVKDLLDRADAEAVPSRVQLRASYNGLLMQIYDRSSPPVLVPEANDLLRPLANTILEKIQWEAKKKYLAAPFKKFAIHRIVGAGLLSFIVFMAPYIVFCLSRALGFDPHLSSWAWLALWNVLSAGLMGAFFSRLLYIQRGSETLGLEELESAKAWRSILLRGAVGMLGALIVFYALDSGLITGKLIPVMSGAALYYVPVASANLPDNAVFALVLPTPDLALLVVWCFVAGFSERVVPDILSAAEGQFIAASANRTPGSG